jgi:peptide/nickel transport system permease protein
MFLRYAIKRILIALLMYVLLTAVFSTVFNGIADQNLRLRASEETTQLMRSANGLSGDDYQTLLDRTRQDKLRQYHLEDPLALRIFWRTVATLGFDFGNATSLKSSAGDNAVLPIVAEALPNTLVLFGLEALLVTGMGLFAGLYAARKPDGALDRGVSTLPMVLNGLPAWWTGMFMLMFLSYGLPLFPSGGLQGDHGPGWLAGFLDYLWHLALPLLTLVLLNVWNMAWLIRNLVAGTLHEDYIMAARARGLPESRLLWGHTLRSAAPAIATLALLGLSQSITGNILVEGIFNWPGLGSLYFVAVQQNDVPVLMAILALQTLGNLIGFVVLDLLYGWLDPRIRVGRPW